MTTSEQGGFLVPAQLVDSALNGPAPTVFPTWSVNLTTGRRTVVGHRNAATGDETLYDEPTRFLVNALGITHLG